MTNNTIRFHFYAFWDEAGQRHYRKVFVEADALPSPNSDPDATPPPVTTNIISIPNHLFRQAFNQLPVVRDEGESDDVVRDVAGKCYNITLIQPALLKDMLVDLVVLFAYIESTVSLPNRECGERHLLALERRVASRGFHGIEYDDCLGCALDMGCQNLPAGFDESSAVE